MSSTLTVSYAKRIAIDGPAGCGKSTLGSQLAERLGYVFIDAGLIYRAITREVLQQTSHEPVALRLTNEMVCVAVARNLQFALTTATALVSHQRPQLTLNGALLDETSLHAPAISQAVPIVAAHAQVRAAVREIQRQIARCDGIVFAGRDIGTVVLPNAEVKIYLDVSLDERANRRFLRTVQVDPYINRDKILADLKARDHQDMTRAESPLQIAADAVIIKADGLSVDEVLNAALQCATL